VLGLGLFQVLQAQFELRDLGIQTLGGLTVFLTPQGRQLGAQMLDLDRRRAKLRARRSQLVPQGGDLVLGRAMGQVHTVSLPDSHSPYKRDHPVLVPPSAQTATSGRAVQAGMRQSIPSNSIDTWAAVRVMVPLSACGQTNRARGSSSRLA
jgi:hypothetical protein